MSYFSRQFIHPSSVQDPTHAPPVPTHQHYQIVNPHHQIQPLFQTYSSIDPSSSSLIPPQFNPHFIDPIYNSGVYHSNYSANNGASSSNWVVAQAPPIKYSTAIQPVRTEAVALTSYEAPPNYSLIGPMESNRLPATPTPVKLPVSQSVRCELCNIECNTIQVYEQHLNGKKHAKCLSKYAALQASQSSDTRSGPSDVVTSGVQGMPGVPSQPVNLDVKNQEQSTLVCKLCNVISTGEKAYFDHLAGKKHIAKVNLHGSVMNPTPVETNAQHTETKKRKSDDLSIHFVEKQRQMNLQKLMTPASVAAPVLSIDPSKRVEYSTTSATSSVPNSQKSMKKVVSEDIETRKQKILNNGAAASAVRTCTICNVVCNSEKAFRLHLTGKRHVYLEMRARTTSASHEHASMVEQSEAASASHEHASMVKQAEAASASHEHASMVEQAKAASAGTGLRFAYPNA